MAFLVFDFFLYILSQIETKFSMDASIILGKILKKLNTPQAQDNLTDGTKLFKILILNDTNFKKLLKEMINAGDIFKDEVEDGYQFKDMPGFDLLVILLNKLNLTIRGNVYIFKGLPPGQKIGAITGLMNKLNDDVPDEQGRDVDIAKGGYKKVKSKKRKSTKKSKKRKSTKKPTRKSRKRKSTKKSKKRKVANK